MKVATIVAVLIALSLTACNTTKTPASITSEKVVAADSIPPSSIPEPPKLSEEQQKNNEQIKTAVMKVAAAQSANKNLPVWVAAQYKEFEALDYTKEHTAFQRSFGWGTGTLKNGKPFYWFAHTNTDAWLQFSFSVKLDDKITVLAIEQKDGYGHRWEVEFEPNGYFGPNAKTWMGVTNFWTSQYCTQPNYDYCDISGALDQTVNEMNSALGLKMVTRGKFPWETLEVLQGNHERNSPEVIEQPHSSTSESMGRKS